MSAFMTLLDICLAAVALTIVGRLLTKQPSHPLPPGPKALPLLGNLLDLPSSVEWETYTRWSQKFGDIMSVNVFGQTIVIISSPDIATEMLEKKSSIYSDRPILPMGGELVGWKDSLVLLPYGDRLRTFRKYVYQMIGSPQNIKPFLPNTEKETHRLLRGLLAKPDAFADHVRHHSGSIILKMAYGWDVQGLNDPFVNLANTAVDNFSVSTAPGAFLVDVIPALKHIPDWFPGAGFKKTAKLFRQQMNDMFDLPFSWCKQQIFQGTAVKSFTSSLLEGCETSEDEWAIKWAAGSLYGAGADTTVAQITAIFKAFAMHPEVQAAAQEELNRVVGCDRLPTYSDRVNLPYISALVNEIYRWHLVAPTGVPHALAEDDVHAGYFIPKGSLILTNIWAMAQNPSVYPNPEKFDPTRFLAAPGKVTQRPPTDFCFGFGRRICPGRVLADNSVFLAAATILATFDISPTVENGVPDVLVSGQMTGTISHQTAFRCTIKPRSEKAAALIQAAEF